MEISVQLRIERAGQIPMRVRRKPLAKADPLSHGFLVAELKDFDASVAILVSSCDAFNDAWRPFFCFFRKFWPDCPFPIYLITNELKVRSADVKPLRVGKDAGWASNMRAALEMMDARSVLYFQEDYFLDRAVDAERLGADFEYAFEHDIDAFCFRARSELEPGFRAINERFGIVPGDSDGRTRCQLTLWKRESFLAALSLGETAWEMESRGSSRTRGMKILSYSTRAGAPVSYLMSAIVRGLWTPEALRLCDKEGLTIAPRFRGTYTAQPFLRRFRRARTRVRFRSAFAKQVGNVIDLDDAPEL